MADVLDPLSMPLRGTRLIEASAGTGKTWTIAALYLRLVLGHGDDASRFGDPLAPAQILVTTFTKAATKELADRVRRRLVEAARVFRGDATTDGFLLALMQAYPSDEARAHAAWLLAHAAEGMDDAAIFTMDAWCQRMLHEHAFDSASLFDEALDVDDQRWLLEAATDYWRAETYPLSRDALALVASVWKDRAAYLEDMQKLQPHVVLSDDEPPSLASAMAEVEPAGAATLEEARVAWRIHLPEMRAWLEREFAAGTFDSRRAKRAAIFKWLDGIDAWVRADRGPLPLTSDARHRLTPAGLAEVFATGRMVDVPERLESVARVTRRAALLPTVPETIRLHAARAIARRVRALKRRAGLYGFADMQQRLDAALAGPNGERLRRRIVAQYPIALVDEFQDTSPLQYRIFDRLFRVDGARDADDAPTGLLLIGDPKQSIFAFRQADIHSYLAARRASEGRLERLTTNYRSTNAVVAAVNRLFERAESLDAGGAFRFRGDDGDELPFVAATANGRPEVLRRGAAELPALTVFIDPVIRGADEMRAHVAAHCATHIASLLIDASVGFAAPDDAFARLRPADVAVLVRNRDEASAVRNALGARDIPSVFLSEHRSVFANDGARDLLHWLRAVADPANHRLSRVAFATGLIGLALPGLARLGFDDAAFEARLDELRGARDAWRRRGVLAMLRATLHRHRLPARWLGDADGERRLTDALHLAELLQAASAQLDGEQALIRWLGERIAAEKSSDEEHLVRLESDDDLVKVMTIYGAKGLEYPLVYLPFATTTSFRSRDVALVPDDDGSRRIELRVDKNVKDFQRREAEQEDVRLLYVALTRATHALWIGIAPKTAAASALGHLLGATGNSDLRALVVETFAGLDAVAIEGEADPAPCLRMPPRNDVRPLVAAPRYDATFERDWSIGSFSAFVRQLERVETTRTAIVDPAVEEELLTGPDEAEVEVASKAARHRFPRGPRPGNFLHDQLEWLGQQRFALASDDALRAQFLRRVERAGDRQRAEDLATWMTEIVTTTLPPIGRSLAAALDRVLPEMEFWIPSEGIEASRVDAACRATLLDDRPRPALAERRLRGMLMGFADLVFEADGRYWVLDYKSNALGLHDRDYTRDALADAMAAHRYDVQAAIYLLALHRLLGQRLGDRYDPATHLGGALYLFIRGIAGPVAGCHVVPPDLALIETLDRMARENADA